MIRSVSLLAVCALLAACSSFDQADPISQDLSVESNASGLVLTTWPSDEDPGGPFYTRIVPTPPHVFHDGEYAAIVFYRGPSLIPHDFDLLQFFDLPIGGPGAFAVPLNVKGTSLWHGQVGNGSPKQTNSQGLGAVPIWFVPAAAVLAKIGEGQGLTVSDLAGIEGLLVGYATQFREVLHPHPTPEGGGHPIPKINLTAQGQLEDGRQFKLSLKGSDGPPGERQSTSIQFH